jgi:hypothetical protein
MDYYQAQIPFLKCGWASYIVYYYNSSSSQAPARHFFDSLTPTWKLFHLIPLQLALHIERNLEVA